MEAIIERKRDLLEAAGIGLLRRVEPIFREDGCFVNVNSLSSTCIAKGGSSRRGGEEREEEEGQTLEEMLPLPMRFSLL